MHEVRGLGAMIGIQLRPSAARHGEQIGTAVGDRLMRDHGILVTVCGGHTVRLLLPFRAGEPELREVWQAVSSAAEAST